MHPVDQAIRDKVIARKHELMARSPKDLRRLAPYTSEPFDAAGKTHELSIWHDKTTSGEDIVVVQCKRHVLLGYGNMFTEGLVLDSTDRIRDAEEEAMWEYK